MKPLHELFDTIDPNECWTYLGPSFVTKAGYKTADGRPRAARRNSRFNRTTDIQPTIKNDFISPSPVWYFGRKRSIWKVVMHMLRPEAFDAQPEDRRPMAKSMDQAPRRSSRRAYTNDPLPQLSQFHIRPGHFCGTRPAYQLPCGNPWHAALFVPGALPRPNVQKRANMRNRKLVKETAPQAAFPAPASTAPLAASARAISEAIEDISAIADDNPIPDASLLLEVDFPNPAVNRKVLNYYTHNPSQISSEWLDLLKVRFQ